MGVRGWRSDYGERVERETNLEFHVVKYRVGRRVRSVGREQLSNVNDRSEYTPGGVSGGRKGGSTGGEVR